ncbi:MAG TPA: hypothetical protein VMT99_03250 [Candidatus Paceibacterota bacterium]|nr:hypothetical protein [Candidatus Paceibacterota bacterium]
MKTKRTLGEWTKCGIILFAVWALGCLAFTGDIARYGAKLDHYMDGDRAVRAARSHHEQEAVAKFGNEIPTLRHGDLVQTESGWLAIDTADTKHVSVARTFAYGEDAGYTPNDIARETVRIVRRNDPDYLQAASMFLGQ